MWNVIAMALCFILAGVSLFCVAKKKGNQVLFSITLVLGAGLVILFNTIPVENLFYTFPTPAAIADYLRAEELLGVVEGQDSCLILYRPTGSHVGNAMIAPKAAGGYKLGVEGDKGTAATLREGAWTAQIFTSARSSDGYLYVTGTAHSAEVSVHDGIGSPFQTLLTPLDPDEDGRPQYAFSACTLFQRAADGTCRITLDDGGETVTFQF